MINQVYRAFVVTFSGCKTWIDLIVLDMIDFDFILGMDLLAPYFVVLDCYVKIITLVLLREPRIA